MGAQLKGKVWVHRKRRTERVMPWRPGEENIAKRQESMVSDAVKRARELRRKLLPWA